MFITNIRSNDYYMSVSSVSSTDGGGGRLILMQDQLHEQAHRVHTLAAAARLPLARDVVEGVHEAVSIRRDHTLHAAHTLARDGLQSTQHLVAASRAAE